MSHNSLFQLALTASTVTQKILENEGELSKELEAIFDDTNTDLQVKVDSYAAIMDRLDVDADFFKAKADSYAKVAKSCKALKERLNNNIKAAMQLMETDEIHGEEMRFKLSRLAPKLVIDEVSLPQTWKMQVVEVVPDKDRIKKAVELGESIPGVSQEDSYSLRKYVNARKK